MPPAAERLSIIPNNFCGVETRCNLPDTESQCSKVLRFIEQLDCETYFAAFYHITTEEYNCILQAAEDLAVKPRLAYSYDTLKLVVEMPSPIHKTLIRIINQRIESINAILQQCIPEDVLNYESHTNLTVVTEEMNFIPDCFHLIRSAATPDDKHAIVIGEVAFSQPEADLCERLRCAIKEQPEVIMIIMATIMETNSYTALLKSSACQTLCEEPSVRSQQNFISECTVTNSASNVPPLDIMLQGHQWFSLESIRFQIWVKCGNGPIDLDTTDSTFTACGELFPQNTMQDFELMMQKGMSLMGEYYEDLSILTSPNMDTTALRAVEIPCPFRWDNALKRLRFASMDTAYGRYHIWYNENRKNLREREEL